MRLERSHLGGSWATRWGDWGISGVYLYLKSNKKSWVWFNWGVGGLEKEHSDLSFKKITLVGFEKWYRGRTTLCQLQLSPSWARSLLPALGLPGPGTALCPAQACPAIYTPGWLHKRLSQYPFLFFFPWPRAPTPSF